MTNIKRYIAYLSANVVAMVVIIFLTSCSLIDGDKNKDVDPHISSCLRQNQMNGIKGGDSAKECIVDNVNRERGREDIVAVLLRYGFSCVEGKQYSCVIEFTENMHAIVGESYNTNFYKVQIEANNNTIGKIYIFEKTIQNDGKVVGPFEYESR